ncbi:MAG TPA: pyridoxamine 5'-phosphate oxidase family protein [Ilumatobacter sp.]|nr:pyridoxamine 5'-phosphate oxidase family protein [Ilumatobacter sp.]
MALADEKYVAFTTFKRDGTAVTSPVWIVGLADGRFGFWTSSSSGKAKRLGHTAKVVVQPSSFKGNVADGSFPVEGTAELATGGPAFDEVKAAVRAKYGLMTTLSKVLAQLGGLIKRKPFAYGDRVVLITLPAQT